jgi:RNA polymerase primary sigma factor
MKQFKINKNITNRSEESLDRYLIEISRVPMITPEQEVELAQIIRKGGKKGDKAKYQQQAASHGKSLTQYIIDLLEADK